MIKTPLKLLLVFFAVSTLSGVNTTANGINYGQLTQTDTTKVRTDEKGHIYPTPPPNANRLFYLQRSPNINALSYDINIDQKTGRPDEDSPVHIYWLRYAEGHGEPAELSYMQRKFAYGVSSKAMGNDRYDIRIMSYKKFPLTLMKAADGKYHIFATLGKKEILLQKVFIQIEGGSFWLPNVNFVEMKGTDPVTGKEVTERFKP
jgi:hypothetical protein